MGASASHRCLGEEPEVCPCPCLKPFSTVHTPRPPGSWGVSFTLQNSSEKNVIFPSNSLTFAILKVLPNTIYWQHITEDTWNISNKDIQRDWFKLTCLCLPYKKQIYCFCFNLGQKFEISKNTQDRKFNLFLA